MAEHGAPKSARLAQQPAPLWKRPAVVSIVIATCAALGLWTYVSGSPKPAAAASFQGGQNAPDAMQQVLSIGKPTLVEFGPTAAQAAAR